ncbi:hypothetical protein SAMN05444392_101399 [Seinonella peptonophila]|uniref:Uncharacterized protein n=1 Tax=Seinonella peptonophila TaxID=112248 RepID=A0A1M4TBR3_9BACL|nr:hypothetical protein [Seinonella peptonophila]SHE41845.1 hypothetical protein SAMN05444392_101399 [Seinonella peptonophila]
MAEGNQTKIQKELALSFLKDDIPLENGKISLTPQQLQTLLNETNDQDKIALIEAAIEHHLDDPSNIPAPNELIQAFKLDQNKSPIVEAALNNALPSLTEQLRSNPSNITFFPVTQIERDYSDVKNKLLSELGSPGDKTYDVVAEQLEYAGIIDQFRKADYSVDQHAVDRFGSVLVMSPDGPGNPEKLASIVQHDLDVANLLYQNVIFRTGPTQITPGGKNEQIRATLTNHFFETMQKKPEAVAARINGNEQFLQSPLMDAFLKETKNHAAVKVIEEQLDEKAKPILQAQLEAIMEQEDRELKESAERLENRLRETERASLSDQELDENLEDAINQLARHFPELDQQPSVQENKAQQSPTEKTVERGDDSMAPTQQQESTDWEPQIDFIVESLNEMHQNDVFQEFTLNSMEKYRKNLLDNPELLAKLEKAIQQLPNNEIKASLTSKYENMFKSKESSRNEQEQQATFIQLETKTLEDAMNALIQANDVKEIHHAILQLPPWLQQIFDAYDRAMGKEDSKTQQTLQQAIDQIKQLQDQLKAQPEAIQDPLPGMSDQELADLNDRSNPSQEALFSPEELADLLAKRDEQAALAQEEAKNEQSAAIQATPKRDEQTGQQQNQPDQLVYAPESQRDQQEPPTAQPVRVSRRMAARSEELTPSPFLRLSEVIAEAKVMQNLSPKRSKLKESIPIVSWFAKRKLNKANGRIQEKSDALFEQADQVYLDQIKDPDVLENVRLDSIEKWYNPDNELSLHEIMVETHYNNLDKYAQPQEVANFKQLYTDRNFAQVKVKESRDQSIEANRWKPNSKFRSVAKPVAVYAATAAIGGPAAPVVLMYVGAKGLYKGIQKLRQPETKVAFADRLDTFSSKLREPVPQRSEQQPDQERRSFRSRLSNRLNAGKRQDDAFSPIVPEQAAQVRAGR